ncbi:conserved hypothetical protein [Pediculus humanus corporis]|uniref:N-myc downstream regulated n=1 Tax=Pediculus humanus subsp. corporis TaxID=121224 RepID=E0VYM0_PEDHC|nr:uncharacterized protein Phum_PHUM515600 [Pediculus humanus corporis]EEB18476.1 conserved hypothetical protein [Pediculus humanus corporis]
MDFALKVATYVIGTEKCGDLHVYVQGDLSQQDKRAVFLTVHDLGCNHLSFYEFVNHPSMIDIRDRSIFIHVDVPGHEENGEALPDSFQFPTLQTLGEDLVSVLNFLHVKYVICLGEGAGANVCARFGLAHPTRVVGMILINCTGSAASVMESFKNKFVNWKGNNLISQSAEDYLLFHKFGNQIMSDNQKDKERVMAEFQARIRSSINSKNLKLYVNAFLTRNDLPLKNSTTDILLITGVLNSTASVVEKLHKEMPDKNKATLLKIERAGDVLLDAPAKVAQAILLFCKGLGWLTSVTMPGIDRQRTLSQSSQDESPLGSNKGRRLSRGMSMEEYDKPNIRRLSITQTGLPLPNKN